MKAPLNKTPILVSAKAELKAICEELSEEAVLGLDTEFIRETSFYPRIALIQVASRSKTWLLDPLSLDKNDLGPLLDLLVNPKILKVVHASHSDQECLFWTYGILAQPVLDTSIAAALCGLGDSIGLQKLLREVLGVHVPKGRARAKWLARPLSPELLHYAEQDVAHLVALCEKLRDLLTQKARWDWAIQESKVEASLFDVPPEEMAAKIVRGAHLYKEEPVLKELVIWRERRAREANIPRGWVADNEVLIALAKTQPKSIDELKTFRGIHSKEIERSGEKIIQAIEKGLASEAPPVKENAREIGRVDAHAVALVQTYISYLAFQLEIMPRFLMNAHQSHQILFHCDKSIQEWVELGLLGQEASNLIGQELQDLFQGKVGLRIQKRKLTVARFDS